MNKCIVYPNLLPERWNIICAWHISATAPIPGLQASLLSTCSQLLTVMHVIWTKLLKLQIQKTMLIYVIYQISETGMTYPFQ